MAYLKEGRYSYKDGRNFIPRFILNQIKLNWKITRLRIIKTYIKNK